MPTACVSGTEFCPRFNPGISRSQASSHRPLGRAAGKTDVAAGVISALGRLRAREGQDGAEPTRIKRDGAGPSG